MKTHSLIAALLLVVPTLCGTAAEAIPPIPRVLPPEGLEIPADVKTRLEARLAATKKRMEAVNAKHEASKPDVEIFTKAVELAIAHREFYAERDFEKVDRALDEANRRLDSLDKGETPWTKATGLVVRGYRSSIDGSAQPYGLVIPEGHDFSKPCPLYVWLHGRGDKNTDLHFLAERASRPGQITPPGAIVVHPFGRHCVGWKHAGEIDVLEAVASVQSQAKIDEDRIVLIGFSMGGAGAWHIGAHYTNRWVAVCPGAGFVDTARYQKITPDRYPEPYVQKLWGLYDVPAYVRNLFNTSVIAYSGELDPQRQAAALMEEAFQSEGRTLTHLIGPGVEHKYEPETLKELLKHVQDVLAKGNERQPNEVHLQTRTLRYNTVDWVQIDGLEEHWRDSRVDALVQGDQTELKTRNVAGMSLVVPQAGRDKSIVVDGQRLELPDDRQAKLHYESGIVLLSKDGGRWSWHNGTAKSSELKKRHALQGPIDDAFMSKFLVVTPTGKSPNAKFQAWCDAELAHFRNRWRALMRAELPEKKDVEFTTADLENAGNLIVWGDAHSNRWLARLMEKTPVNSSEGKWTLGQTTYDGDRFVPACIYPLDAYGKTKNYIVLNSGLTFREGHDRTNSQQNPKLPDWAIIDLSQPPDALAPGKVHDADFFDEKWQLKRQPKAP